MKILFVSEKHSVIWKKQALHYITTLLNLDMQVEYLVGEKAVDLENKCKVIYDKDFSFYSSINDEHRFIRVIEIANSRKFDFIILSELLQPAQLYNALETINFSNKIPICTSICGVSTYLRRPIYAYFLEKLLKKNLLHKLALHSNHPKVFNTKCKKLNILQDKRVKHVHNQVLEPIEIYNEQNRSFFKLKKKYKIPNDKIIILYFGSWFISKGYEVLLSAAQKMKDNKKFFFIFAGNTKSSSIGYNVKKLDYLNTFNGMIIDKWIDDSLAATLFKVSNVIALPYMKYYEYNTSGLVPLSAIAERPIIVPDIFPFKNIIDEFKIGHCFKCEKTESIIKTILSFPNWSKEIDQKSFQKYLTKNDNWKSILEWFLNS